MSIVDLSAYATHEVLNQPPALADYDAYGCDRVCNPSLTRSAGTGPSKDCRRRVELLALDTCKSLRGKPIEIFPNCERTIASAIE